MLDNINTQQPCPCGSTKTLAQCCLKLINGDAPAQSAEQLMRSRYSAFVLGAYPYLLSSHWQSDSDKSDLKALQESNQHTQWLSLRIIDSQDNQVEFCAYYREHDGFYCLHERSNFIQQDGNWFYTDGELFKDSGRIKPNRNEPCLCGSTKKFKRCCGAK